MPGTRMLLAAALRLNIDELPCRPHVMIRCSGNVGARLRHPESAMQGLASEARVRPLASHDFEWQRYTGVALRNTIRRPDRRSHATTFTAVLAKNDQAGDVAEDKLLFDRALEGHA